MRIVRVQYTAKEEYVEKNKENIARVMKDLRAINNPGIKYSTYLLPDQKSFMHFSHFETDELRDVLNNLESFRQFQNELKENGLETPVKSEQLSLVASCFDIFPE